MISCDTNILFPAVHGELPDSERARMWLETEAGNASFVLCELVLVEVYMLLRNPAVLRRPLGAAEAVAVIEILRSHPCWRLLDYIGGLMDEIWKVSAQRQIAFRRITDTRLAITLRHHGVTHFATANEKDFAGFGFQSVWNPIKRA